MGIARIWLFLVVAGLLAGSPNASHGDWSVTKLVPFGNSKKSNSPSALDQIGNGTKKVVHATTDLVTLKWLPSKEKVPEKTDRWSRRSRKAEPAKKPFFGFLFPAEEPTKPSTLGEWMAQERLDP